VREKYCSGKLNKTDYKPDEQGQSSLIEGSNLDGIDICNVSFVLGFGER
jgi:hypothetical protein